MVTIIVYLASLDVSQKIDIFVYKYINHTFILSTLMIKKIIAGTCLLLVPFMSIAADAVIVLTENESEFGAEFLEALRFSYDNGLTRYKDVQNFNPYAVLTREQASKIIWVFASKVLNKSPDQLKTCSFPDLNEADLTLKDHIIWACRLGIFKGSGDGNFYPTKPITKAEWLTVLIRMMQDGSLDENVEPWYLNYYQKAKEFELTREKNVFALDRPLTRYEMILLLYRFYVKLNIIDLVNNNKNIGNDVYGINTVGNGVTVFDHEKFTDSTNNTIAVSVMDNLWRLEKTNLVQHYGNAATRYGDVYAISTPEEIPGTYVGVATFNLIDGQVADGNIRPIEVTDNRYEFSLTDVAPFYQVQYLWDDDTDVIIIDNGSDDEANTWSWDSVDEIEEIEEVIEKETIDCSTWEDLDACNELAWCDRVAVSCNGQVPQLWCTELTEDFDPLICG